MDKTKKLLCAVAAASTVAAVESSSLHRQQPHVKTHHYLRKKRSLSTSGSYCGAGWQDAHDSCNRPCPSGNDSDCGPGNYCYRYVECIPPDAGYQTGGAEGGAVPTPASVPTTQSPNYVSAEEREFFVIDVIEYCSAACIYHASSFFYTSLHCDF